MSDFEKCQIRIILRNNPGITQAEILQHIKDHNMPGNWYHQKVSILLKEMEMNNENITRYPCFRNDINRQVYKYYYGENNK